ncbi:MAG: hypothetical protein HY911_08040 [Desulfobacterales bacterium]|nr:hypothetical protein [Desulfobacterales bacterium]
MNAEATRPEQKKRDVGWDCTCIERYIFLVRRCPAGKRFFGHPQNNGFLIALAGHAVIEEPPNYWENGSSERAETDRCGIPGGAKGWGYN